MAVYKYYIDNKEYTPDGFYESVGGKLTKLTERESGAVLKAREIERLRKRVKIPVGGIKDSKQAREIFNGEKTI